MCHFIIFFQNLKSYRCQMSVKQIDYSICSLLSTFHDEKIRDKQDEKGRETPIFICMNL